MKAKENERFIRWCILGAIGGILMAAIYEKKRISKMSGRSAMIVGKE